MANENATATPNITATKTAAKDALIASLKDAGIIKDDNGQVGSHAHVVMIEVNGETVPVEISAVAKSYKATDKTPAYDLEADHAAYVQKVLDAQAEAERKEAERAAKAAAAAAKKAAKG